MPAQSPPSTQNPKVPKTLKTLKTRASPLAEPVAQLRMIRESNLRRPNLPKFEEKLRESGLFPLRPTGLEILQVNVGKLCNQACGHCHVDAGPERREIIDRPTLELCLSVLSAHSGFHTVDITGGAPEMVPDFRWFVEQVRTLGRKVMVRCNLTILLSHERFRDLPFFFRKWGVHVVSSLPYFQKGYTDRQRGEGVFEKSIRALQLLNEVGYGKPASGLELDLVYNPAGAFLPGRQEALEEDFKRELRSRHGVEFNRLYTITNMPISRFLEYLEKSGNLEAYMEKLVGAFNPHAAGGVMCRNMLSVDWKGWLYDCDFNQMLSLGVEPPETRHLETFDAGLLERRSIVVDQHCYGCTAGAGSSCGGAIDKSPE